MKTLMKLLAKNALLLLFVALMFDVALAQSKKKEREAKRIEEVKKLITDRRYVFEATYMMPMRGGGQALTDDYDIHINRDSLISYLPYFGRAYQAPIDPTKNALDFTSTKFEYFVNTLEKGGWEITIIPKDNRELQKIYLTVSVDGYATLRVSSANRDPISFDGTIEAPAQRG